MAHAVPVRLPLYRSVLGAALLTLAAVPALATDNPPAPSAAPAAQTPAAPAAAPTDPAQQKVAVSEATAQAAAKMTCRNVKVTGSNLRTRKVCSTPDSQAGAGDWVRQQQERGALNASAIVNSGT